MVWNETKPNELERESTKWCGKQSTKWTLHDSRLMRVDRHKGVTVWSFQCGKNFRLGDGGVEVIFYLVTTQVIDSFTFPVNWCLQISQLITPYSINVATFQQYDYNKLYIPKLSIIKMSKFYKYLQSDGVIKL